MISSNTYNIFPFSCQTRLHCGDNLRELIGTTFREDLTTDGGILLITGRSFAIKKGLADAVEDVLRGFGPVHRFEGVGPDPRIDLAVEASKIIKYQRIKVVVALGGGSVIDLAKVATSFSDCEDDKVEEILTNQQSQIPKRSISLVAIPTTAGTGSEVTPYAVLTGKDGKRRFATSPYFMPTSGLICSGIFTTVPRRVIREIAFDAWTHALEALWSKRASSASDQMAIQALSLFHKYLRPYYENPEDQYVASQVALGATLAGIAFSKAFTVLCHALSFPLGETLGLSHGKCCALTAAQVAQFNDSLDTPPLQNLSKVLEVANPYAIPDYIRKLRQDLGDSDTLISLGLTSDMIPEISRRASPDMVANNMKKASIGDLERILLNDT